MWKLHVHPVGKYRVSPCYRRWYIYALCPNVLRWLNKHLFGRRELGCKFFVWVFCLLLCHFFAHCPTAPSGPGPPRYWGFTITLRYSILGRAPLDEWSAPRRPVPDNTQLSKETDIHSPGGIRTRNSSKRVAADACLRPRGPWNRLLCHILSHFLTVPLIVFLNNQQILRLANQ
jgi:hypothetical protein